MGLSEDDLDLLACLLRKKVIGNRHRRVDSIAGLCHIRNKKGLKRRLRSLAGNGYLTEHHGPGYSLTDLGWRVGAKWDEGWSIDEIEDFVENEKTR